MHNVGLRVCMMLKVLLPLGIDQPLQQHPENLEQLARHWVKSFTCTILLNQATNVRNTPQNWEQNFILMDAADALPGSHTELCDSEWQASERAIRLMSLFLINV